METVDLVILGMGLSGTLTALQLAESPWLAGKTVLLVDPLEQPIVGRGWSYWSHESLIPEAESHAWTSLILCDDTRSVTARMTSHTYRRLSGARLTELLSRVLAKRPEFRKMTGAATVVGDTVFVGEHSVRGRYILDSVSVLPPEVDSPRLSFLGVRVAAGLPEPGSVRLMDMRVPQSEGVRFIYALPALGLVELTAFSAPADSGTLNAWLDEHVGVRGEVVEAGDFPLLRRGNRRVGDRRLLIGRGAGVIRSSSGYCVVPIHEDAVDIRMSLAKHGHPFDVRWPDAHQQRTDRIFLEVMRKSPPVARRAYLDLFERNDPDQVLAFLNGRATVGQYASLAATLPKLPFLRAAARVVGRR